MRISGQYGFAACAHLKNSTSGGKNIKIRENPEQVQFCGLDAAGSVGAPNGLPPPALFERSNARACPVPRIEKGPAGSVRSGSPSALLIQGPDSAADFIPAFIPAG
jgi:hypothetical protein